MALFSDLCGQTQRPEGFLGKLMVSGMDAGHEKLSDWGMSLLKGIDPSSIAKLGCGGGRNARELLKLFPEASLTALDHSEVSLGKTVKTNRKEILSGRCRAVSGDVSELPFESETFDLATAFETVYYWPGAEMCFREVYRVLRPKGLFLICNESDGTDEVTQRYSKIMGGMSYYTAEQLTDALENAGFSEIRSYRHPEMPWIAVAAGK